MMAYYKFNKIQIHLTDDQGWRLPVPGYPKLKSISSKRKESMRNGIPVSYTHLPDHPDHDLYKRYYPNGGGSIFTF